MFSPHAGDDLPLDPDLAPDDPAEPGPTHRHSTPASHRQRTRPDVLAAIAGGGAIGTVARAALGQAFPVHSPAFPSTTLGVNLAGSFILGVLLVVLVDRFGPAPRIRPFLTTGILGGFTTFSTFMVESVQLTRHGHVIGAIAYVIASTLGGVALALVGIATGRRIAARAVPDPTDAPEMTR